VKKTHAAKDASIWGILKKNIGKNLSKISMPVAINEPLSVLQRLCEDLEHCQLLDKAADCEDPALQLLYVAAFAVSGYVDMPILITISFHHDSPVMIFSYRLSPETQIST